MTRKPADLAVARTASRDDLLALLGAESPEVLAALLENPNLDEGMLCRLLERKNLSGELLQRVARKPEWIKVYAVRLRLARHPHTPRLISLAIVRQLYLFDLAQLSLLPSAAAEVRRLAEEIILNRIPQLPLGQKLTLARRGSGRVAAALLVQGLAQAVPLALDNAFLNETHVLRVLSHAGLAPAVVAAIAKHAKWSYNMSIRFALVRHPLTPLARVLTFLPDLTLPNLRDMLRLPGLRTDLRQYLEIEVARRAAGRRRS